MPSDLEKILDKLQALEVSIAVMDEKITQLTKSENNSVIQYKEIEKRVDRHDKIVGALIIVVAIFTTMVKFKLI